MLMNAPQIAALEVKLASYSRKAKRLNQPPVIMKIGDPVVSLTGETEWEVSLEGNLPKVEGYEILGKIEPLSPGLNLVSAVPGKRIPGFYRECDIECDHCGHNRRRNSTIVLREIATNATRQVGHNCLSDYIRDKNASRLMELAVLWSEFEDGSVLDGSEFRNHRSRYIHLSEFLTFACMTIRQNGFVSKKDGHENSTANKAICAYRELHDIPTAEDVSFAKETLDFFHSLNKTDLRNEFMWNLWSLAQVELIDPKTIGYVVCMPETWRKEKTRRFQFELEKEKFSDKKFIGTVGEKFYTVATLADIRPMGDGASIVKFLNDEGDVLSWWSNKAVEFVPGTKVIITGTIKAHKLYGAEPTTQIVRPKVRLLA